MVKGVRVLLGSSACTRYCLVSTNGPDTHAVTTTYAAVLAQRGQVPSHSQWLWCLGPEGYSW
jgi:hypothetical protein